jgi:choice-of-anchor B domain-containing protein
VHTFLKYIFTFHLLFLGFASLSQDAKNLVLLDKWNDTLIPIAVEEARYSDLWGFEFNEERYCAVGSSRGLEILAITNNELSRVAYELGAFQGYTVVHRDFKTYQNYLYAVCDEGTSTLQIFDLTYLPDSLHKVYDSNALFSTCHNIYIDTAKAKLYACAPNNLGMKVFSLNDPELPVLLHDFTTVNYVHDCFVINDTAFLNCGIDGLQLYDFSGATPIQLGALDFYVDQGYNHSGWRSKSGKNYAFIDETEGTKIKLCHLGDLAAIKVDALFGPKAFGDNVPHNIIILEKLAFVAHYNLGLRVFDISQSPIQEVAYYDTYTQTSNYKLNGAWGVFVFENQNQILICDRQNGVFLFHFPIQIIEQSSASFIYSSVPFLDENSVILPRAYFNEDGLKFSIYDSNGRLHYYQESLLNWCNIPLELSSGAYVFSIYDSNMDLLESGKFVKAN